MAYQDMSFMLIFSSGGHFVQQSGIILAILIEGHPKNRCEIILKSGHWPRRCHLKVFLFLDLVAILFSRADQFSNFGKGSPKEHFCEIIFKLVYWSRSKCHLKFFLFLALVAILFSKAEQC